MWSGIRFRQLMEQERADEVKRGREKAVNEYGVEGLHLAEAVQSRAVHLMEEELEAAGLNATEVSTAMKAAFAKPRNHFRFIAADDDLETEVSACQAVLEAHKPKAFVVAGSGSAADDAAYVATELSKKTKWYDGHPHHDEGRETKLYVFISL